MYEAASRILAKINSTHDFLGFVNFPNVETAQDMPKSDRSSRLSTTQFTEGRGIRDL